MISCKITAPTLLLSLATLVAGCAIDDDSKDPSCPGGKCDGEDVCVLEAKYGDGTCDTDCAQSDLDCFRQFDDSAAAYAWFTELEKTIAQQESRAPRTLIPPSDPRYAKMRALLEQGWDSYKRNMPVGQLERAPELVMIDDPSINAFVAFDRPTEKVAWAVMVQTGALEATDQDYAILGVVMHELNHATALHVVPGVGDRIRIHYQVSEKGGEPFGFQQQDDPRAREIISAWRELGEEAGNVAYAELNGLPMSGSALSTMLSAAFGRAPDVSKCTRASELATELNTFVAGHTDPLTSLLTLATAEQRAELSRITSAFLTEARDVCLAGVSVDLFQLMAEHFGVTAAEVEERFPAEEQAMVAGRHVIDQITILAADRFRRMRDVAALLQQQTGRDLTTLRYFSTEEAADDASVAVLAPMNLPPDGVGEFFVGMLPDQTQAQCRSLVEGNVVPPYGDLVDEHHATCWRAYHVKALGAAQAYRLDAPVVLPPGASTGEYARIAGPRLPRWHRASDDLSSALHRH